MARNKSKPTILSPQNIPPEKTQLVSGFPSFPVYPEAKLISSAKGDEGTQVLYKGTWETRASVPDITNWYIPNLKTFGWNIDTPPLDPQNTRLQFLSFRKDDKYLSLSVIKDEDPEKTMIIAEFLKETYQKR